MSRLFARMISPSEYQTRWMETPEEGWWEIENEIDHLSGEYPVFDIDLQAIVIKKLEKTPEEIATEEKVKDEAALFTPEAFAKLVKRVEILEGRD